MVACGADIIVDDVLYISEPMFQDGPIAEAIASARGNGVAFFSAAGNLGWNGVLDAFEDAHPADDTSYPASGRDFHVFADGDPYAAVTVPAGCGFRAVMQWAEPFDGMMGSGALSDYDLLLCSDADPLSCVPMDGSAQGCSADAGGRDPIEIGSYTNDSAVGETVYLAVDQYCGDDVPFRIVLIENCTEDLSFEAGAFGAPEMYGHSTSSSAAAIGAVFFGEVDESGAFTGDVDVVDPQPFSSKGGSLPFYFGPLGTALDSAEYRSKPDCAAPDGGNTSFFGVDLPYDADSMPNFVGTSSAAAHAAGIAALVLQYEPTTGVDALMERLRLTAVDIGEPGWDAISGDGRLDALRAITYDTSLPLTLTSFDAVVAEGYVTLRWTTASEDNVAGFDVQRREEGIEIHRTVSFVAAENAESSTYEFRVEDLAAGPHVFRLKMVDLDGTYTYSPEVEVQISIVDTYALSSVYPNPFNPEAAISIAVDRTQEVEIGVFDLTGRRVALLHSGVLEGGHSHRFRITSDGLATGIYFVKAVGASFSEVRPVMLVK